MSNEVKQATESSVAPARDGHNHDRRGRATPGNNLRGEVKAKRQRGLARMLAQETENGLEMGRVMLGIARDPQHRDRFKAADWVVVRLMGKPVEKIELTGQDGKPLSPLAGVDVADLLALARAETEEGK